MRRVAVFLVGLVMSSAALSQDRLAVYAAGSLRAPLVEAARAFELAHPGTAVTLVFGASGLLRDRIVAGETAHVFASANMEHPQALAAAGGWSPARVFARNALCALAPRTLALTQATVIDRLLDERIRVGTSTPRADPSGDYAFEMFARIGARPGAPPQARRTLEGKALQLTGGPTSPPPPAGRNVYGALVAQGQADIFITYCTNALVAVAEEPQLQAIAIPADVNVIADYGVTVRTGAPAGAQVFTDWLRSAAGQQLLVRHGFTEVRP
jgi:molybdate transport system substrate-binding protein